MWENSDLTNTFLQIVYFDFPICFVFSRGLCYNEIRKGVKKLSAEKDLRVYRTKKSICDAFVRLLERKGFQAITIQDIADEAMINRSTFYAHYTDKYDLLEKYTQHVFAELDDLPGGPREFDSSVSSQKIESQYWTVFDKLFEHVGNNAVFYRAMLNESLQFEHQLQQVLFSRIQERIHVFKAQISYVHQLDISEDLMDTLFCRYFSCACVGIITWWLDTDMLYSPKQISRIFTKISTMNMYQFYGNGKDLRL